MTGVYPAAARVFAPWKNGGGETAEILTWPEGAGLDDFTLRLSTAWVARSGPFSVFPGVDRVLSVLEGGLMRLRQDGAEHVLGPGAPPFAFAGDRPCHAGLEGPPLLDFNVMIRRPGRVQVRACRFADAGRFALLLAPVAGLARLDLIDRQRAEPALALALTDAPVLSVDVELG